MHVSGGSYQLRPYNPTFNVHTNRKQAETNRYFYTETGYVPPQDIYPRSAKIYKNVYLFELNVPSLQIQRNNRELETIIQECSNNYTRQHSHRRNHSCVSGRKHRAGGRSNHRKYSRRGRETRQIRETAPDKSAEESADVEEFIKDDREEVPFVPTVKI
jgi:hypothetical protein